MKYLMLVCFSFWCSFFVLSAKGNDKPGNPGFLETSSETRREPTRIIARGKEILPMEKGESQNLPISSSDQIWLSQSGIVSIRDTGSYLNIQARKEGEVLLNLDSQLYLIYVLNAEKKRKFTIVRDFLSNRRGLKTEIVDGQIRIRGRLYRIKDFLDFSRIAQEQNFDYLFEAEVEMSLRQKIQTYIQNTIKEDKASSLPSPVLLWHKPLTVLIPDDPSLTELYKTHLKRFGVFIKKDPTLLPSPPLIELKLLLVESSANHSFQTHIDWGEKVVKRLLDGSLFKELLSTFKTMEDKGQARIFSSATLLMESGKKSHFHSGGEVPIPHFHPERETQGIKWKPYGVQLNFTAKADRNQNIYVDTQANISEVDHTYSSRSAPSLKSSRIHSSITMKSGQSFLLSKLIRRQTGRAYSAPAEIFRLPLAGRALSFKGKIKEYTRLNIFITAVLYPKGRFPFSRDGKE
ncbi:MAG: type II and III secretion system protein, partial [Oligoflexia bacterium]|nr:type II and III secretion system protein [Oligoflexia bacterium]